MHPKSIAAHMGISVADAERLLALPPADVYEDAVRCPVCENYITQGGPAASWADRPWWWVILGLLGTLAAILFLTGLVR